MKRLILIAILITLLVPRGFSQSFFNSLSVDLRYPITTGNNFMNTSELGSGYQGIADAGIGLNVIQYKNLSLGAGVSASLLRLPVSDLTATGILPKMSASYDFRLLPNVSFIPQTSLGYSYWNFKAGSFKQNDKGATIEGSFRVVFRRPGKLNFYLSAAYQHTRLQKPRNGAIDSDYNRNINIICTGIGFIWKLK